MEIESVDKISVAYIAGFFDGEGCVYVERDNRPERANPFYVLVVQVDNSDRRPLKFIKNFFGFGSIWLAHAHTPKRNPGYRWLCKSNNAFNFLKVIYPYLQCKKEQAELAIDFQLFKNRYIVPGQRQSLGSLARCEDYYKQIRTLKRGNLDGGDGGKV